MGDWLFETEGWVTYLALFVALCGGAVGLPIPEDLPLLIAGVFIQSGHTNLTLTFLTCYLAIITGDTILYGIGRKFGPLLFSKEWFRKRLTPKRLKRIRVNLERRSLLMIFIARHLFYFRTVTFLTCGAVRMRFLRFLVADLLAALMSVPIMMTLGYFAAEHYEKVLDQSGLVSIILGLIVAFFGYRTWKKRTVEKQAKKLPPVTTDAP